MDKLCISFLVFCLATITLMATSAESADISAIETTKESKAAAGNERQPWNTDINLAWVPDSGIHDSNGKLDMRELEINLSRSYQINSRLSISAGLAYSLRKLDAPAGARLPDELHTLSVEFCGNYQLNEKTVLTLLLSPGLNGDFKEIGAEDIRTQIGIMGSYNMTAKLTLLAGLIYQQGYESFPVLPVIGASYRPNEQWTLSLGAPRSGVTYSPNRTSSYYIEGEFAGSEYQLHDASLGAKKICYGDVRAIAGAEFLLFTAIKVTIAGGYAFERKFEFHDGFRDDVKIDDGPFARLGVSLSW